MAKPPANPGRSFGLSVGGLLCIVAALLVWRGRIGRAEWTAAIGAPLLVLGATYPRALRWPSTYWWRFSRALGHFNARVLLTLLFFLVLTPIGALWRLLGRDPLTRERAHWKGWSRYPERYSDPKHFERMF